MGGITAGQQSASPTVGAGTTVSPQLSEEEKTTRRTQALEQAAFAFTYANRNDRNRTLQRSAETLSQLDGKAAPMKDFQKEVAPQLSLEFATTKDSSLNSEVFKSLQPGGSQIQNFLGDLNNVSGPSHSAPTKRTLQKLQNNTFSFIQDSQLDKPETSGGQVLFNQHLLSDYLQPASFTQNSEEFFARLGTVEKAFGGDAEARNTISEALGFGAGTSAAQSDPVVGEVDNLTGEAPRKETIVGAAGNSGIRVSTLLGEV